MSGKYKPLELHLISKATSANELNLSFVEIESIIKDSLPESAYVYREWWSNQSDIRNRPQAYAWVTAGYFVDAVNQDRGNAWVRFKRQG
jgi:hypothetical protein